MYCTDIDKLIIENYFILVLCSCYVLFRTEDDFLRFLTSMLLILLLFYGKVVIGYKKLSKDICFLKIFSIYLYKVFLI